MKNLEIQENVIQSALKMFATHGYSGTEFSTIAKESSVAEPDIKKMFTDKGELFKSCFEYVSKEKMEIVERTLRAPGSLQEFKDRIQLFVDEMINAHLENPYHYEIVLRETNAGNELMVELYSETLKKVFFRVVSFFEVAKNLEFIDTGLEPRLIARLLVSAIEDVGRKDKMVQAHFNRTVADEDYRDKLSRHIVKIMLGGILRA